MVDNYRTLHDDFRWHVPRDLNIAVDCCLKWAQLPSHDKKVALAWQPVDQAMQQITFSQLGQLVCQLANGMQRLGVIPGDRVLVLLGRPIEALAVIMACWATGAVAVPLSPNEESDALIPKLKQARGRLIFIDDVTEEAALAAVARCPRIQQIVGLDIYSGSVMSWRGLIARQPTSFEPVQSLPSNPALLIWPEQSDPNFTAGTALMLAQQALIGNLPGFVMTTNWFPDHASGLMTTLLPWDEPGLLAAILPTLYFGFGVTIDQRDVFAVTPNISHVITTPTRWCQWLQSQLAQQAPAQPLRALTLLGHCLSPYWRDVSEKQVATHPNLAMYVAGCGLALGQNQARWPAPHHLNLLRAVPGFEVGIAQSTAAESTATEPTTAEPNTAEPNTATLNDHTPPLGTGSLTISRFDAHDHPNPAQYVQIWPFKESLDGSGLTEPPLRFETHWPARAHDTISFELLDEPNNPPLTVGPNGLNAASLEQALLTLPCVAGALVIASPQKKAVPTAGLWLLVQLHEEHQPVSAITRRTLEEQLPALILEACGYETPTDDGVPALRVGLVTAIERNPLDQPRRSVWTKRAKFVDIDFLPPSRPKS
jgi:acetyl-CoA synthetase